MKMPMGFRIVTSSAWADTFRPSLDAHDSLPDVQDNFFVMHPFAATPNKSDCRTDAWQSMIRHGDAAPLPADI